MATAEIVELSQAPCGGTMPEMVRFQGTVANADNYRFTIPHDCTALAGLRDGRGITPFPAGAGDADITAAGDKARVIEILYHFE